MLTQAGAVAMVTVFGAAMVGASLANRGDSGRLGSFLVANRSVGTVTGALSVAGTWIWAPALFIAAQKAFQQGLAGAFWFTAPNVACLVVFAFLAARIRKIFPQGYTLPQYVAERFGTKSHLAYLFCFLSLQVCSLSVQLIAGAAMLHAASGLPYAAGVALLVIAFTSYALLDGLRASIRTDVLQVGLIFAGMALLVPRAVMNAGGMEALAAGLGGITGAHSNIFDPAVAYGFGITVTIGLMSGPVGDQQHWQRAFAFREGSVVRGYLLGALVFAMVPLTMSLLGFAAAGNPAAAPAVVAGQLSAQQVGPEVVRTLLPPWGIVAFTVMILAGLASTGDSALCAGGSLVSVDIFQRYVNPLASERALLRVSRLAVLGMAAGAVAISLIPGITILSLFLFYGTLRSSTLMPTIWMLYRERLPEWGIFWGVALAVLFGLPTYLWGEMSGNVDLKVIANLGIVVLSGLMPFLSAMTAPASVANNRVRNANGRK